MKVESISPERAAALELVAKRLLIQMKRMPYLRLRRGWRELHADAKAVLDKPTEATT